MSEHLEAIRIARTKLVVAEGDLRGAVERAIEAGESRKDVAEAMGVSRQVVYERYPVNRRGKAA